jgi:hypothetical protein
VRLDRTVAIKILPSQLAADPQFRDRFGREARTISQLTDGADLTDILDVTRELSPFRLRLGGKGRLREIGADLGHGSARLLGDRAIRLSRAVACTPQEGYAAAGSSRYS